MAESCSSPPFTLAAKVPAAIARHRRGAEADAYRADAEKMAADRRAWLGRRLVPRAYDHFGNPVGSAKKVEVKIFLEPQGMCVMAGALGITATERADLAGQLRWAGSPSKLIAGNQGANLGPRCPPSRRCASVRTRLATRTGPRC